MPIVVKFLFWLFDILKYLIIIQCIMSWIPGARMSKGYEIISMFTEPLVGPIRELLFKFINIPIDFSPIVAFFVIDFAKNIIIRLIW